MSRWTTLAALVAVVAVVPFAEWLNGWSLYAFPLGTLVTALCVPLAMLILIVHYCGSVDTPPENPQDGDA